MGHKLPTDDWGRELHPHFYKNIEVAVEMLTGGYNIPAEELEEMRYQIVRQVMIFARQEFTPNE